MAKRPDSEALGQTKCITPGCEQTILVFRTARRGHHLYGRCPDCGPLQSTSKAAQTYFSKALDGFEPSEALKKERSETIKTMPDYDPGDIEPEPTTPTKKPRSVVGLLMLIAAIGGGLLTIKR